MLDAQDLDDRLIGRCLQHAVVAASAGMPGVHRTPECFRPETRGLVDIGRIAVDEQGAETRMMHDRPFGTYNRCFVAERVHGISPACNAGTDRGTVNDRAFGLQAS